MTENKKLLFTSIAIFGLSVLAYLPGLSGGFHFDDRPNLEILGAFGQIQEWSTFWAFLNSGIATDFGRPLSLATFALNAQDWPADPWPFIATNILVHALNAVLVFLVIYKLLTHARVAEVAARATVISFLSAALWALHPFLVSTTLYIVQRMTMLSAMFVLLGLLFYLFIRWRWSQKSSVSPTELLAAAIGLGLLGILGFLCKENAVLLPLLLLVLEYIGVRYVWKLTPETGLLRAWVVIVLVIPSVALILFLAYKISAVNLTAPLGTRDFTGVERLLSIPPVWWHYIQSLLMPKSFYPGLYYDGHPLRVGAIDLTFTLTLVGWMGGILASIIFRKVFPYLALGVFFFIAGHLLESFYLGLEPIFEHRNYLPAIFLFLPISVAIGWLLSRRVFGILTILLVTIFGSLTYSHAALWGNPLLLKVYWAKGNTYSTRAQISAADALLETRRFSSALDLLHEARKNIPNSAPILMTLITAEKRLGLESGEEREVELIQAIRVGEFDTHLPKIATVMVDNYVDNKKGALSLGTIDQSIDLLIENPRYQHRVNQSILKSYRLKLNLHEKRHAQACSDAHDVLDLLSSVNNTIGMATLFANSEFWADALDLLNIAEGKINREHGTLELSADWYREEVARLRGEIMKEAKASEVMSNQTCSFGALEST